MGKVKVVRTTTHDACPVPPQDVVFEFEYPILIRVCDFEDTVYDWLGGRCVFVSMGGWSEKDNQGTLPRSSRLSTRSDASEDVRSTESGLCRRSVMGSVKSRLGVGHTEMTVLPD